MFKPTDMTEYMRANRVDGPIPGQVFTSNLKGMPMDRPPQEVDPKNFIHKFIKILSKPKTIKRVISLIDVGTPIDILASQMLSGMVREGITTPQVALLAAPAVVTMIGRMGEAANLEIKVSNEGSEDLPDDFDRMIFKLKQSRSDKLDEIQKVAEISTEELSDLPMTEGGLMKKPEELI